MTTRTALRITAWCSAGLVLFTAGLALGQLPAPTDYNGVTESVLAAIDLAREIDSVENRELRVSRATGAPGRHIGLHSHQGGPRIVYVSAGVLTNHHDDGATQEVRPGQVFAEFGPRSQTTHRFDRVCIENHSMPHRSRDHENRDRGTGHTKCRSQELPPERLKARVVRRQTG